MSTVLSKDASITVYNSLIANKILNNEGRVTGEDLSKIVEIDFGTNKNIKQRILNYCVKLKSLQDADNKEVRVRVASNIEDMITGRIMHLIKADILSPSIATGLGGLSNVMLNKLSNASKVAKEGVRQEMSKHYNRVAFTVDNENSGNGHYKLPLGEGDAGNGGDKPKVAKPKDAATKPSVFVPRPSDSMYLEPLSDQLARPVFVYKNGKLDRVVGARHKGAEELSVDYVMGKGWTTNGDRSFALTGSSKEEGVAQTSILFKKPDDPRVRLHSPYSSYLANGKMVEPKETKPTSAKPSPGKPVPPTGKAPSPTATNYTWLLIDNAKQKATEWTKGTKEYFLGAGKSESGTVPPSGTSSTTAPSSANKASVFGIPTAYAGSGTIAITGGEAIFTLPLTELAAAGGAAAVRALSPLALPVTVYRGSAQEGTDFLVRGF